MKACYLKSKYLLVKSSTLLLFLSLFFTTNKLYAADTYSPSETFVIGEFIYEDDYTPTTDDCTISIFSPAGATLVDEVTMSDNATGWHYYSYTAPATEGKYPAFITCGTALGGDLLKVDKSFRVESPEVTDSSIAASVWGSGTRTLTAFGSLAADVWNDAYASVRRLTDKTLSGGGSIATESYIDALETTVVTEVQSNGTLIAALNDISASDVWAAGTRTLTSTDELSSTSIDAIWDRASSGLTTSGSIGKLIVDNLDEQVSTRGTSNLTAGDVWSEATRTLSTTGVDNISAGVWSNAGRTLTNYGNDITAADVWNILSSSLTATGSIGEQLALNIDGPISDVLTEVQNNGTLIAALNDISAADVWAAGTRTLTGDVTISSGSVDAIWDTATTGLTAAGSVGKLVADNLDAQVSTRGTSNLTAADVWSEATRTLTDYSTSSVASAVWANAARTLTNYGNDITADDVWNSLTSSLTTVGSIGKLLTDNVDVQMSDVLTEVQANGTLIAALNDISAADVWAAGTRTLTGSVDISSGSVDAIWDTASSGLTASGSVGKLVVDNLDAQVSSVGGGSLTAADIWSYATRTLSTAGVDNISAGVWSDATRTLTNYGNDITADDVWNVLSSSLTAVGSIGEQLATNIDEQISAVLAQSEANAVLIGSLNNISATDVWAAATRSLTSTVDLSTASEQGIWDIATINLSTAGSIGRLLVDNIDEQISTRGVSNLTASDVWSEATRTLTDYSDSSIASAVWANATRTLTNYGNDITAADVWNVLSSSLTVVGSIGEQVSTNLDASVSSISGASNWNVRMGNVERVQAGYTYRTKVFVLDSSSNPTAPVSVPLITLYDASRNVVASNVPTTLVSTGIYEYTYSVASGAAQGLWETIASTEVESGKIIQTNDYWEVAGSPAQVLINSVSAPSVSSITANVTITNEGLTGYEYQYEWCVVSDVNNTCGGNDDIYHATAAKFINPAEDFNTNLSAVASAVGTYYFKLVVYFGTESSSSSRVFTISAGGSGGSGGGGSTTVTPTATPIDIDSGSCDGADFNRNGSVDSVDFSILLYFWKTPPPFGNPCVDINKDAKVDSVDFSIMLFEWSLKSI